MSLDNKVTLNNITDSVSNLDSNFLPKGTIIKVELDGSGDFTNINDAFTYLEGKYSNGSVTIQIGEGTFPVTHYQFGTWKFGIPYINIWGSGSDKTILYDSTTGNEACLRFNDSATYFQVFNLSLNCSTTDTIPFGCYNANVRFNNISSTNCRVLIDASSLSNIAVQGTINVSNCIHQVISVYATSTLYLDNVTINCNNVNLVCLASQNSRIGGGATIKGSYTYLKNQNDTSVIQGI